MSTRFKSIIAWAIMLCLFTAMFAGCSRDEAAAGDKTGQKVELELFSNKSESKATLEALIAEFEAQNPNIHIKLNQPPEAETVLMTRLNKNEMPDLLAIGGNATFGEIARAGAFRDMTKEAVVKSALPSYLDMLNRLVGQDNKKVYGIPYATNANGVLYNKDQFKELGLEIPKTWDELVAVAEKIKSAGKTPFYFTLGDAWTGLIGWNALAANIPSKDFTEKRHEGATTFKAEYGEVADKVLKLLDYGHDDNFGKKYPDGNNAFANGASVMYLQGNWAISDIRKANPNMNLGIFAFPATNNVEQNKLVSGVDVLLTVSANTKHPKEAMKFIEFMTRKEIAERYITEQFALSAVNGVIQKDPIMDGIAVNFEKNRITSFPDHYYPPGMQIANLLQAYLSDRDKEGFLSRMDEEWDNVKNRQ
ncbi:MAG: ABC transporter substrate-binding protein [Bacillota bacterium]